jgi:hypothetical protein
MILNERLPSGHKSLRLSYRDYSVSGTCYAAICDHDNRCAFGRIENDQIEPSPVQGRGLASKRERMIRAGEEFSNTVRYMAENPVRRGRKNENQEGAKIQRPC